MRLETGSFELSLKVWVFLSATLGDEGTIDESIDLFLISDWYNSNVDPPWKTKGEGDGGL